jgi:hypothetical protein
MKLIKKAEPATINPLSNLDIGDKIIVQLYNHSYKSGSSLNSYKLQVIKINKVTFEAKDVEGNVYLVHSVADNWEKSA